MTAIRSKPSSQTWRRSSATSSSASFSTKDIAATMRHPNTSSGCSHQARSAGGEAKDKARAAQALRRRAGDRPPQIRASNGPELSLAPPRRRRQRRPRRRRLQLPASPPLAAALVAPNPRPAHPSTSARPKLKSGFFTDDYLALRPDGLLTTDIGGYGSRLKA